MPPIEINDLGSIGVIVDTPPHLIPPEAFTQALNCRVVDGGLESLLGWEQIFGTPGVAPHFAVPIRTSAATFWLYVSLTKAYGYDGTTHTDVTRAAGDYTGSETREWNGTLLANIPILNNGIDIPQFWSTIALGTKLANLTNWPATTRAKVIRAFGPFLMAFNITKAGSNFPHMIKWSHPADPGTIPASWDETDPTRDAGEFELPDVNSGLLLDGLPLGEIMYAYKESSIWKVRFVGGSDIFSPGQAAWLTTTGILAPRCVTITGDGKRHVFASQDDILWHDGNQVKSLLTERRKKEIFNAIDTTNYINCFMFTNPNANEVWFCYPTSGNTHPNKAVIFNYARGGDQWPITDADGITFRNGVIGNVQGAGDERWSDGSDLWSDDTGPWSTLARRRVILCGTNATKFYNLDKGATRDGTSFTSTLQRLSLAVTGKKRNGEWIVDFDQMKMADRIWLKARGGPISVRMGVQQSVEGAVTWNTAVSHDPTTGNFVDAGPTSGRAISLEFSSSASMRLDGYSLDVIPMGQF